MLKTDRQNIGLLTARLHKFLRAINYTGDIYHKSTPIIKHDAITYHMHQPDGLFICYLDGSIEDCNGLFNNGRLMRWSTEVVEDFIEGGE